jgi:hypothetical protein
MKKRHNPTIEVLKCTSTQGFTTKYAFPTEQEAKEFYDKLKAEIDKLSEFLKPISK